MMAVRLYHPTDDKAVHQICADTAFFGAPLEAFFGNRHLFNDYFAAAYTEFEPEHLWVAEADGRVIGYLMGCPDTARLNKKVQRHILPRVLARLIRGAYRLDAATRRFVGQYVLSLVQGQFFHVDLTRYPAHLHLNIAERWRGRGLGRQLLTAYLEQLRAEGIPGVHLETSDHNTRAVPLYEKLGFRLLDRRPSTLYRQVLPEPVYALAYGLRL